MQMGQVSIYIGREHIVCGSSEVMIIGHQSTIEEVLILNITYKKRTQTSLHARALTSKLYRRTTRTF